MDIMNRRSASALLLGVVLVLPMPAWAQGNGNGNANGNGQDGNSRDNGNGNGDNAGGNGNGNGRDRDPVNSESPGTATGGGELSENEVLAAVKRGSAVSLESLLPDVRSRTGGEIINAKLQETRGSLLYAVTVLTPGGKVVTEYYRARSGLHVGN